MNKHWNWDSFVFPQSLFETGIQLTRANREYVLACNYGLASLILRGLYGKDKSCGGFFSNPEVLFLSETGKRLCLLSLSEWTWRYLLPSTEAKALLQRGSWSLLQDWFGLLFSCCLMINTKNLRDMERQGFSVTDWYSPFILVLLVMLWPGFGRSSEQPFYHKRLLVCIFSWLRHVDSNSKANPSNLFSDQIFSH